jgi:hypothetical protein
MKSTMQRSSRSVWIILILTFSINLMAQEKRISKKEVPQAVLSAFASAYPKAKVKGYSTETENGKIYFEVESHQGKMTLDVSYLTDGTVTEIEEGVATADLPSAVKKAIKSNFPKGRVIKAEKKTVGDILTYEMKIITAKGHSTVEIDRTGKILKNAKGNTEQED